MSEPKVEYILTVEQDETPVRGNAISSGDPSIDKEVEDGILKRLEAWDVWAWALVKVEAKFEGFTGVDYLGGCNYDNEKQFLEDAYFEDLKARALENLFENVEAAVKEGERAAAVLKVMKEW